MGKTGKFTFRDLMVFIVLSAAVAIAYQLPYINYTFYDQMAVAFGIDDVQMGVISSVVSLTSTLCYPLGGIIAEKFSMRKLMLISIGAFVLIDIWYAFAVGYVSLIVIHVLYGFFGIATLWSAYLTGIRNLGNENNQSTMFGSSEATRGIIQTICGFVFVGIMGFVMGSTVLDVNNVTPDALAATQMGWRYMVLAGAGITAVFFVLGFIFLPKDSKEPGAAKATTVQEKKYTFMDVFKNKGVWITIMVIMCAYILWSIGNRYLTTYTVQVLNIDTQLASTLGIVRSYIIVFVAGFLGGWVLDRFSYKGTAFFIMFVCAIALLLGVIFTSAMIPLCVAITLIIAFLANIMKCTYWSIMGQAGIPVGMTALATGVISFIAFIPDFVLPIVCGNILTDAKAVGNVAGGFYQIFAILICFAAVGIVFSLILKKRTASLREKGLIDAEEPQAEAAEVVA